MEIKTMLTLRNIETTLTDVIAKKKAMAKAITSQMSRWKEVTAGVNNGRIDSVEIANWDEDVIFIQTGQTDIMKTNYRFFEHRNFDNVEVLELDQLSTRVLINLQNEISKGFQTYLGSLKELLGA